ncbi:MAG: SigE family RNA polymerase sigma factor [Mycobacteriales bacterium]
MTGTLALYETGSHAVVRTRRASDDADVALTGLYTANYGKLVRIAALLLDDVGLSEEVVQDAYIKVHAAWGRLRDQRAAEAYLRTAVVNLSRSRMRRRQVAQKHAPKPMPDAESAEQGAMDALDRDRVLAALRSLPRRQQECLVLRYYGDLSEAQIAEAMGISAGAVKSHASRGMSALRERLEETA